MDCISELRRIPLNYESHKTAGTNSSVDRALHALITASEIPDADFGISDLARLTGMSKTVVHRISRTLVARDFFAYDEQTKRYSLGAAAAAVGLAALGSLDVPQRASPHLVSLVEATGETVTLSARVGGHRTYVRQILSPREIRMSVNIGRQFPLYQGGSSIAILSALENLEIDQLLEESISADVVLDFDKIYTKVEKTRKQKYSTSLGERQPGAASVACAIRQMDGEVWGSASVCGPADRFSDEEFLAYGQLIHDAAGEISRALGFQGSIY